MLLLVQSSPKMVQGEAQIVKELFDNGLETFHLRKKNASTRQIEEYLNTIPRKYWSRIVLHSHYSLAIKYDLKGIHLNRHFKKQKFMYWLKLFYYRFKKPSLQVSSSFNNLSSLYNDSNHYDYVFLSPVFDSVTKSGYQSSFSQHNLAVALMKTKHKIMALGGIQPSRFDSIKEMGFSGMVLSDALWNSDNSLDMFKTAVQKLKEVA
jgi:thiamine-phosphate pyrophosphorylase